MSRYKKQNIRFESNVCYDRPINIYLYPEGESAMGINSVYDSSIFQYGSTLSCLKKANNNHVTRIHYQ